MEHESFENPEVAKLMNENFISIKVDREERPDIDQVYMTFVQATTGSGGWPMTVFLTPDLKPFVGGTYFPPRDKWGQPGMTRVLNKIAEAWKSDRERIVTNSDKIISQLQTAIEVAGTAEKVSNSVTRKAYDQFASQFDAKLGGFGESPKFPRPVTLNFLFDFYGNDPESKEAEHALEMALFTLRKMAEGGIHDHIGGGFHRYSTDKFWHVPHFEKMLYDQAQLAIAYLTAFQITRDPLLEKTARDTLDYVRRDMTDKDGGFYSAEDADSLFERDKPEHGEGAFYIWTKKEIDNALGRDDAEIFNRFYGVESQGNAPAGSDPQGEFAGKNTLIQRYTVEGVAKIYKKSADEVRAILDTSTRKLFAI